ncbi:PAS domain S-box protein [Candidatus Fermentibacteria bacterium]|nr:PAS domain S-box protein [Candidatus Fermentibacteria bacterium]
MGLVAEGIHGGNDEGSMASVPADGQVRAGEEYLRAVLDSVNDAVFVDDAATGQIIDVNQRTCEMYGYAREEVLRIPLGDLSQGEPPYSQNEALEWLRRAREGGPQVFPWLAKRKNGSLFWVEVSIRFTRIGAADRFVVVVRDITERWLAEESLRVSREKAARLLAHQTAMNRLALALGETLSLDEVYRTIHRHIGDLVDVWCLIISSFDEKSGLIQASYAAADQEYDVSQFPAIPLGERGKGTQSRVLHSGEPLYTPDHQQALRDSRFRYTVEDDGAVHEELPSERDKEDTTRSAVYLPMKVGGKTVGVMQVQSRRLDAYTQDDIVLLAGMANVAAVALQNARLREDLVRELAERTRAEDARGKNEARLEGLLRIVNYEAQSEQELLDHALEQAVALTASTIGYIYYYDEATRRFTLNTWSKDVMKECTVIEPQAVYALDKTGAWGEAVRQEMPIVINDFAAPHPLKKGFPEGHAPVKRFMTIPVRVEERIVAVVGVANKTAEYDQGDVRQLTLLMDSIWKIVERRRAQEALRESERRFATLAATAPIGIFRTDADGATTYVNRRWSEISGLRETEALGDGWLRAVHPDDRARLAAGWHTKAREGVRSRAEYRFIRPDGTVVWVWGIATPEVDAQGESSGYIGAISDITERRRAEEQVRAALEEKEVLLREVHHRVKNNLQAIIYLIDTRLDQITDTATEALLRGLQEQARAMALVYEQIYQSEDLSHVHMGHYLEVLVRQVILALSPRGDIDQEVNVGDVFLEVAAAIPCGLIVNELVTNSLKYAFPPSFQTRPRIGIALGIEGDRCCLAVEDNGIGIAEHSECSSPGSTGLRLVHLWATHQLGGTISREGGRGTRHVIHFPLPGNVEPDARRGRDKPLTLRHCGPIMPE